MEFQGLVVVAAYVGGVMLARSMAIKRGQSPLLWGACTALFSPLLVLPVLFFFPVTGSAYFEPSQAQASSDGDVSSSGVRKKKLVVGALFFVLAGYGVFSFSETSLKGEFEKLLADNDLKQLKVVDTRMSPLALLGGRNDVDVFVEVGRGEVVRLGAIVIGSPIFEYYLEIPGTEMLKIRF